MRSIAFYDIAFGLKVADGLAFEHFTLVYLSNPESGFELELTINSGRTDPYDLGNGDLGIPERVTIDTLVL